LEKLRSEASARGEDPSRIREEDVKVPYPASRQEINRKAMMSVQSQIGGLNWNYALTYHTKVPIWGRPTLLSVARTGMLTPNWTTTQGITGFRGLFGALEQLMGGIGKIGGKIHPWIENLNVFKHLKRGTKYVEGEPKELQENILSTSDFATAYFWRSWVLRRATVPTLLYLWYLAQDEDEEEKEAHDLRVRGIVSPTRALMGMQDEQQSIPTPEKLYDLLMKEGTWWPGILKQEYAPPGMDEWATINIGRDESGKTQHLMFGKQFLEIQHLLDGPFDYLLRKEGPLPRWWHMFTTGTDGLGRPLAYEDKSLNLWGKAAAWVKVYGETFLPIFLQGDGKTIMTLPLKELSAYKVRETLEVMLREQARTGVFEPVAVARLLLHAESERIDSHKAFYSARSKVRTDLYGTLFEEALDGQDSSDVARKLMRLGATAKDVRNAIGISSTTTDWKGFDFVSHGISPDGRLVNVARKNRQRLIDYKKKHGRGFEEKVGLWANEVFRLNPRGEYGASLSEDELKQHRQNYTEGIGLNEFVDSIKLWSDDFGLKIRSSEELKEKVKVP
jgi:hypothetical protein